MLHCDLTLPHLWKLRTIYVVQCTMYTIHYSLYNVQCTMYTIHCTLSYKYSSTNINRVCVTDTLSSTRSRTNAFFSVRHCTSYIVRQSTKHSVCVYTSYIQVYTNMAVDWRDEIWEEVEWEWIEYDIIGLGVEGESELGRNVESRDEDTRRKVGRGKEMDRNVGREERSEEDGDNVNEEDK